MPTGMARSRCGDVRRAAHLRERRPPLRSDAGARRRRPRRRAGRGRLPARAVGLREDDAAARRRRHREAVRRPRAHQRARGRRADRASCSGGPRRRPDVPGLRAVPAPHHPRQRRLRPQGAAQGGGAARGAGGPAARRACRTWPTTIRTFSRAASSSAWRSPAPSFRAPRSCSWTSRSPASTCSCVSRCRKRLYQVFADTHHLHSWSCFCVFFFFFFVLFSLVRNLVSNIHEPTAGSSSHNGNPSSGTCRWMVDRPQRVICLAIQEKP